MKHLLFVFTFLLLTCHANVDLGVDCLFRDGQVETLKGKRIGLITNQTGVDGKLQPTIALFKKELNLTAIFSPEHGWNGLAYAGEQIKSGKEKEIPVHSLHGNTRRPTAEMLKNIDILVYDIQEIGARSYTYATTLYYMMEAAAENKIPLIILDRPNPMSGLLVDGPMLQKKWRSFLGYIDVPYCHGMTIGELARYFNEEYEICCDLRVIKMRGWERWMSFEDTGLFWIPTSPHIPEADTPLFYASTGILGELGIVNIGVGYTQPFKLVGAPWINAEEFADSLNGQKLPGVKFIPYYFRPFYGIFSGENCQGIKIIITDRTLYRPLSVQYLIIGMLKSLYPKKMESLLKSVGSGKKEAFCQVNGNDEMLSWLLNDKYIAWKMIQYDAEEREEFLKKRIKYLLY